MDDRSKNMVQEEESVNLSSNPLISNYPFHAAPPPSSIPHMDWNPGTMLDNLTFIEGKIGQVKNVIRSMAGIGGQLWTEPGELMQQQQQHQQQQVNAELTCLIVQIISTAGSLLPSLKNSSFLSHSSPAGTGNMLANLAGTSSSSYANLAGTSCSSSYATIAAVPDQDHHHCREELQSPDYEEFFNGLTDGAMEGIDTAENIIVKDVGNESGEACMDGDSLLPPGSYELLQLEEDEILAPHTHFCAICGKGFKRDANLRMHMRGHGDEYKSNAALTKPPPTARDTTSMDTVKRYSCPFPGCKRNKLHRNFLPLKTIMCVKNHYRRSHCEKSHTCSRCHSKKFSIMADLKTHEKHCGQIRWLCSCGTSFSRKDKLFAHVGLFKGHTPLLPADDEPAEASDKVAHAGRSHQEQGKVATSMGGNKPLGVDELHGACSDDFLSTTNFGSFYGFPQDHSLQGSFGMLPSDDYLQNAENNGDA